VNAWLLTWEGTTGPALVAEQKILAILSSRRSSSSVADLVDVLYTRCVDSASAMASRANKRKLRMQECLHLGSTSQRFFYGRNPCIFARVVTNIVVVRGEREDTELVRWSEIPVFGNAPSGSGIIEVEPGRDCKLMRCHIPLSDGLRVGDG
jgi:hypothetical protein